MKKTSYAILGMLVASFVCVTAYTLSMRSSIRPPKKLIPSASLCTTAHMPAFTKVQLTVTADDLGPKYTVYDENHGLDITCSDSCSISYSESWGENITWSVTDSVLNITAVIPDDYSLPLITRSAIHVAAPSLDCARITHSDMIDIPMRICGFSLDTLDLHTIGCVTHIDHCEINAATLHYLNAPRFMMEASRIGTLDAYGEYDIDLYTNDASIDTFNWHTTGKHTYYNRIYQAKVHHFNWLPECDEAVLDFKTKNPISIVIDQK